MNSEEIPKRNWRRNLKEIAVETQKICEIEFPNNETTDEHAEGKLK